MATSVKVKIKQGMGTRGTKARLTFKCGNQTGDPRDDTERPPEDGEGEASRVCNSPE